MRQHNIEFPSLSNALLSLIAITYTPTKQRLIVVMPFWYKTRDGTHLTVQTLSDLDRHPKRNTILVAAVIRDLEE